MNLKTVFLGVALSLPISALADTGVVNPFAGAFVGLGANGALVNSTTQTNLTIDPAATVTNDFSQKEARGLGADVLGGYNVALNDRWLLGLQLDWSGNNIRNNLASGTDVVVNGDAPGLVLDASSSVSGQFKLQDSYGLNADLGYLINPHDLLYAGLGLAQTKLKANGSYQDISTVTIDGVVIGHSVSDGNFAFNKTLHGLKVFLGAQQSLTNHLSLREQASYTAFRSVTENVFDATEELNNVITLKCISLNLI